MEYDEIRITTRREINVCRNAIKKLEVFIEDMEEKYHLKSLEMIAGLAASPHPLNEDFVRWRDSYLALKRWQERLAEHEQIMNW